MLEKKNNRLMRRVHRARKGGRPDGQSATEESTARDEKVPSQAGHQPLLLLLQNMEMVFTGADRLLLLRSCRVTAMSHRPLRSLLTWDVILPYDPCMCLSPPIR